MPKTNRRRAIVLSIVFVVALALGPGPGATLIDGTAEDPNFVFGVPALYLWALFWCAVLAGCILVAAKTLWKNS